MIRRWLLLAGLLPAVSSAAGGAPPPIALGARETVDFWDNASGGRHRASVLVHKLQLSGTISNIGLPGLVAHAQIFRTDGKSLSARVGDIQTVSNIEAPATTRLFEAWLEQTIGDDRHGLALRAGLMDLNAQFDANDTASLFINSSHGIGPDISRSGRNGPSIFPVTSAGASATLKLGKGLTLRLAAFDGVPGAPERPKSFVSVHLRRADGALVIGQADYQAGGATIEGGLWRYSVRLPAADGRGGRVPDQGCYASVAAPLPGLKGWNGWVRAGFARGDAQPISGYVGAGLVAPSPLAGRPDDRFGLAFARASISDAARRAVHLPRAETTVEATYQISVRQRLALQPDIQFVRHPAAQPGAADAVVVGTRLVLTFGYPVQPSAIDAADPTVSPG